MVTQNFHIGIWYKIITPYIFLIKFTLEKKKRQSAIILKVMIDFYIFGNLSFTVILTHKNYTLLQ